jgi:pimeloyl-ACP methyl ester carboxylesterase
MSNLVAAAVADTTVDTRPIPSAEAWFAGGQRVGYDPDARATIAARDAPLKVFVRREGDIAHAVTFLPGFPDGSFGWAKVRPQLPHAAEMPKLFFDYVGMGDSEKPEDYAYSTAEPKRSGAIFPSVPRRSSPSTSPRLSCWSICAADSSA